MVQDLQQYKDQRIKDLEDKLADYDMVWLRSLSFLLGWLFADFVLEHFADFAV